MAEVKINASRCLLLYLLYLFAANNFSKISLTSLRIFPISRPACTRNLNLLRKLLGNVSACVPRVVSSCFKSSSVKTTGSPSTPIGSTKSIAVSACGSLSWRVSHKASGPQSAFVVACL